MDRNLRRDTDITNWRLNGLDWVGIVLLLIGGLNWGLVGLFDFSLIDAIFGTMSIVTRIIYVVVGLAALWAIISLATHVYHKPYETGETRGVVAH